jgi:hypothetical protein
MVSFRKHMWKMWKKVLKDYQVALEDLDKVSVQWTKSALSLRTCAHEKKTLQGRWKTFWRPWQTWCY